MRWKNHWTSFVPIGLFAQPQIWNLVLPKHPTVERLLWHEVHEVTPAVDSTTVVVEGISLNNEKFCLTKSRYIW